MMFFSLGVIPLVWPEGIHRLFFVMGAIPAVYVHDTIKQNACQVLLLQDRTSGARKCKTAQLRHRHPRRTALKNASQNLTAEKTGIYDILTEEQPTGGDDMTEQKKKTLITGSDALLAVLLAYGFRWIGKGSFYPTLFSYLRSFLYIGLFAAWGAFCPPANRAETDADVSDKRFRAADPLDDLAHGQILYLLAAGGDPLSLVSVLPADAVCAHAGCADCAVARQTGWIPAPEIDVDIVGGFRRAAPAGADQRPASAGVYVPGGCRGVVGYRQRLCRRIFRCDRLAGSLCDGACGRLCR